MVAGTGGAASAVVHVGPPSAPSTGTGNSLPGRLEMAAVGTVSEYHAPGSKVWAVDKAASAADICPTAPAAGGGEGTSYY